MPDDSKLSPKAVKRLLALKQKLRLFLKRFDKLEKGSKSRTQYTPEARNIKDLYLALSLMDLVVEPEIVTDEVNIEKKTEVDNSGVTETTTVEEVSEVVDEQPKTNKEKRKARREKRKAARKEKREERRANREAKKIARKTQHRDKSGAKEESQYRFDNLIATWEEFQFDQITSDFRSYLDQGEQFLKDAANFISYAETFTLGVFDNEIEQAKELIEKTEKFIHVARNISKQIDRYAKIAQDVVNVTLTLPTKVEKLKDGVVAEATKIFAAAKNFIATADVEDEELELNVETLKKYLARGEEKLSRLEGLVGEVIKDEDGDNLPDWYNRLEAKYNELFGTGTDLIPGTKIDDKILLQITGLKKSVDKFIAAAADKVEALDLQEKLQNAQQWLGQLSKFTEAITGFVENIKEGDLVAIYEDLKDFKNFIDSDEDLLAGTNIDDKIKKRLQEYSKKAATWLMNALTGGDPDKEDEVRSILGSIDKIILSSGGVVDHSSKYEKDEDKISIPDITDVSQKDIEEVLAKYGIRKKNASYEGILSDMKDQADNAKGKVAVKFKAAVTRGSQASNAFRDAKEEYDQAIKKHNDYFRATNSLGKRIINGLLSIAGVAINSFAPGVGEVIGSIGDALLGEFDAINGEIDKVIPSGFEFIGDLAKDLIPGLLPQWGSERGLIQIEGKELLKGLNELYINGVSARYKEVIALLNTMKTKASNLGKNLRSLEQADTDEVTEEELNVVRKKVIILEKKWTGLKDDIMKKYINLKYPPIDQKKAYRYASRYLYSVWLIRFPQKEIRISDTMIEQFEKFGVMKEANAEWDTGFWAGLGRGFFGFFGGDPFDYRAELKKMKTWAAKENDALKSAKAWAKVF